MPSKILIQNGDVIQFNASSTVSSERLDVLIIDDKIVDVGQNLQVVETDDNLTTVIDASGHFVCPGFVDCHHHLWQTQLKGLVADDILSDYIWKVVFAFKSLYSPEDGFIGQLAGALESIYCGVTSVVDHSDLGHTMEHVHATLCATKQSGLRCFFCPAGPTRQATADIITELMSPSSQQKYFPIGGRMTLGLAFDGTVDDTKQLFDLARQHRLRPLTMHIMGPPWYNGYEKIKGLDELGALGSDVLFSHGNNLSDHELQIVKKRGCRIMTTPETELQMGHGFPMTLRCRQFGFPTHKLGLGVDCHSTYSGDFLTQMRLLLQSTRNQYNETYIARNRISRRLPLTVSDVFRLATIDGAHCLGMGHLLGSIERGKKADLILIDNRSPTALGTASDQSAAAIVLHANVGDIRWVIVDGQVKKKDGKLVLDQGQSWKAIATELETSRNRLMKSFGEKFSPDEIEELKIKATNIMGIKDILED